MPPMVDSVPPQTVLIVGPDLPGLAALRERLRDRGALLAHTDCLPQAQQWLDTLAPDLIVSTTPLLAPAPCRQLVWDGLATSLDALLDATYPPPGWQRGGELLLDADSGRLALAAQPQAAVTLPATELRLLLCLLRRQGRAVSRQELMQEAWPPDEQPKPRSVDQVVHRLRELLAPLGLANRLRSLRGLGYRFDLDGLHGLASPS
jgi:Transcriptional regulatory protein, C terminal